MIHLSYQTIQSLLLTPFSHEAHAVKALKDLHLHLQRRSFSSYTNDPKQVSAYTLFYLPTNFPKLEYLLHFLPSDQRNLFLQNDFVELGSGPGTYLLAYLAQNPTCQRVIGVERSNLMRESAQKILSHFFPAPASWQLVNQFQSLDKLISKKKFTLFLGHSLCEIGATALINIVDEWEPQQIAWIEPGDSLTFLEVKEARQALLERGYSVLFPCPCPDHLACPVGPDDWCHQVMKSSLEPEWQRLAQLASIDRRYLPMIAHFYTKKSVSSSTQSARLFRFLGESKASLRLQLCYLVEGQLQLIEAEILKRSAKNRDEWEKWTHLLTGETLTFTITKRLSDRHWRIVPWQE